MVEEVTLKQIVEVSFPIGVAWFLLVRNQKALDSLTSAVTDLKLAVNTLTEHLKGPGPIKPA